MKSFSIVCYLEGDVQKRVRDLQHKITDITGSRRSIDSWMPHITIGSGIVVEEDQEKTDALFEGLSQNETSFELELSGFGGTENRRGPKGATFTPYVLWINPIMNDSLRGLFSRIKVITDKYDTFFPRITQYVPHVTIAYDDLDKEGYIKGREYLKGSNFKDNMLVNHISLVEYSPDKDVEHKRFYFSQ